MSEPLTRIHGAVDLELRGSDGRTVTGIAVPFDQPTEIHEPFNSYREVFRCGAFTRTLAERGAERVKLLALHNGRNLPLGRLSTAREVNGTGLVIEARVSKTQAGDEALELVRDGALDAFSIGFVPMPNGSRWNRDRTEVERVEVRLQEVSLVPFPAYAGAAITGVRSAVPPPYDLRLDPAYRLRLLNLNTLPRKETLQ